MMSGEPDLAPFRLVVTGLIREIEGNGPEAHSTGWYLLKYLRRILRHTEPDATPYGLENGMRALLRFYVDLENTGSSHAEICRMVIAAHRNLRWP